MFVSRSCTAPCTHARLLSVDHAGQESTRAITRKECAQMKERAPKVFKVMCTQRDQVRVHPLPFVSSSCALKFEVTFHSSEARGNVLLKPSHILPREDCVLCATKCCFPVDRGHIAHGTLKLRTTEMNWMTTYNFTSPFAKLIALRRQIQAYRFDNTRAVIAARHVCFFDVLSLLLLVDFASASCRCCVRSASLRLS